MTSGATGLQNRGKLCDKDSILSDSFFSSFDSMVINTCLSWVHSICLQVDNRIRPFII